MLLTNIISHSGHVRGEVCNIRCYIRIVYIKKYRMNLLCTERKGV